MVQHIHIHSTYILPGHHNITDSTCVQHVNFGLTQAHPNNWYGITSGLVSKAPLNPPPGLPMCTDILHKPVPWASYEKGSWVALAQKLPAEGAQMPHLQPKWPLPNNDHNSPGSVSRHHCAMPQWVWCTWHAMEGTQEAPCSMSCRGDPMWLPWMWYNFAGSN